LISTEHFVGQKHLKGKNHNWAKKTPLEEIMVEYSEYSTGELKKRLLRENILQNKCDWCSISEWRNKKIQCELDHINGNRYDHRRENLRMLCPNCHSQTETFRGRNKVQLEKIKSSKKMQPPRLHKRKVVRPLKEQLEKEIKEFGFTATGRKYGVSDNTIRKWNKSV
jgi:Zn finger protein HypA/HybF involved in hydrogenase expression